MHVGIGVSLLVVLNLHWHLLHSITIMTSLDMTYVTMKKQGLVLDYISCNWKAASSTETSACRSQRSSWRFIQCVRHRSVVHLVCRTLVGDKQRE